VLPGSTEMVLTAKMVAYPAFAWHAFGVALLVTAIGYALKFGMGQAARSGWERFRHIQVDEAHSRMARLRRFGPPVLVLSVVPLIGDALALAAGWLKMPFWHMPFWHSLYWIVLGKLLRHLLLILGLKGLHANG
jgi:membrane protein YqaA with SNARE-associated domain